jgi:hypothetical protein
MRNMKGVNMTTSQYRKEIDLLYRLVFVRGLTPNHSLFHNEKVRELGLEAISGVEKKLHDKLTELWIGEFPNQEETK